MEYITSIRAQAEPYGICKVVAPKGWIPESETFAENIDMSTFCFETKVQPLSKLQNRGLLSDEFFHELAKAHERSSSDLKPPFNATLVQQSILPGLYVSVIIHGGYDAVVKSQKWNEVALCINYSVSDLDGDGAPLSAYYRKYLLPLEKLCSESQEGLNRL